MGRRRSLIILIKQTGDTCYFQCEDGTIFTVSPEDKLLVITASWKRGSNGRIHCSSSEFEGQWLARVIAERIGLDLSGDIDHKDQDKLNNKRDNLRAATRSQNQGNTPTHVDNLLKVKGVRRLKSGKFEARINGQHLGCFTTIEAASTAYQQAAKEYFGEYAST